MRDEFDAFFYALNSFLKQYKKQPVQYAGFIVGTLT